MKGILVILILYNMYISIDALKCYTCSVSVDDPDQTCVTNPENVAAANSITNCDKKYCISIRIEYLDPKDTIQSMSRSCVDEPTFINEVIDDGTFKSYFVACTEDLCNGGTGKDVSSGNQIGDVGEAITLLVPGTGTGAVMTASLFSIILMVVLLSWGV